MKKTLDEMLEADFQNKTNNRGNAILSKKDSKKKRNKIITTVVALALALAGIVTGLSFRKHDKSKGKTDDKNVEKTIDTDENTTLKTEKDVVNLVSVNDLGDELEIPVEVPKVEFGEVVSGNINTDNIVESNNELYVNEEALNNSEQVGEVQIETTDNTYVNPDDGQVYEKEIDYEIVDGNTKEVIEEGNGAIPPNYEYDEGLDKVIEKEEVGKNAYADKDYYGWIGDGTVWGIVISKGTPMEKEDLEEIKQTLSTNPNPPKEDTIFETTEPETSQPTTEPTDYDTVKPSTPESNPQSPQPTPEPTNPQPQTPAQDSNIETEEGVINPDGTYTLYGTTFRSKADYEQWVLQGYTGYALNNDGIMVPEEEIIENGYITEEEYEGMQNSLTKTR